MARQASTEQIQGFLRQLYDEREQLQRRIDVLEMTLRDRRAQERRKAEINQKYQRKKPKFVP